MVILSVLDNGLGQFICEKGREFAAASADELLFLEVLHTRTKYLVHIVTATVGATTVTAVTTVAVARPVATIGAAVTGF